MLPVLTSKGSTRIVYVPVAGLAGNTIMPPPVPTNSGEVRLVPSGWSTDTLLDAIVTLLIWILRCCAAVALNVRRAFCPAVAIVTGTADPPMTIVPVMSVIRDRDRVMLPILVDCGSSRIVYVPVTGTTAMSIVAPPVPIDGREVK